jgi:hypothetical protein
MLPAKTSTPMTGGKSTDIPRTNIFRITSAIQGMLPAQVKDINKTKRTPILLPQTLKILDGMGQNIRLARLRRKFSTAQVAERAGISRATLWQIENGKPTVAMGYYFQVLFTLGLENDFLKLGADDELGRKLQDAGLVTKGRAPKN